MWRLVLAGVATFTEMEQNWDITLVFEANLVLNYKLACEDIAQQQMEAKRR